MQTKAETLGYGGVCISPGGSLAIKYIKENKPKIIVAVACKQELEEGKEAVQNINPKDTAFNPTIIVIKLKKDGCVNTEVDIDEAITKISS